MTSKKYTLAVGALFKNEQHAIQEWLNHYLYHGVSHFYLIDDESTDQSVTLLAPYIERGLVTLYHAQWSRYIGRQRDMYNHFILPHVQRKEMQWLYIADLDEFLWSPRSIHLPTVLADLSDLSQIQFFQHVFASNGHAVQPPSIVKGFTKRWKELVGTSKYMINSDFEFTYLNVHHATFKNLEDTKDTFLHLDSSYFMVNHYMIQSQQLWDLVKCTRGDGDEYRVRTREEFNKLDRNDVEDLDLVAQNAEILRIYDSFKPSNNETT